MTIVQHELTILAVEDVAASVAFYAGAFGWTPRVEVPVYVELALPDGRGLGLYQRESFGLNTGRVPPAVSAGDITGAELYLRADDFEGTLARLESAGARLLSARAPRPWGDEVAYFADPTGNVVALARRIETDP